MRWETLTTNEVAALDRDIPVVLNVAAIEQHGPHLPPVEGRVTPECSGYLHPIQLYYWNYES